MGLITENGGIVEGYEAVPLPREHDEWIGGTGTGTGPAVLRRRSARPSKRAVIYLHCLADAFVPPELATWYTDRGFHFYVADLRGMAADGRRGRDGSTASAAGEDLSACFGCLDTAIRHVRDADAIETVVVGAHGAGALVAALWCHARRGSQPVDALVLAAPEFGPDAPWLARAVAAREASASARRGSPLLASAQRRLRRGLDIACPVLVMCPATGWDAPGGPGGLLPLRVIAGRRATTRLGEHVTWLRLDGGAAGQVLPAGPERKRFFDELGRWLGAYLSGQVRDQLL